MKEPEYRIGTAQRFGPNRLKEFKHMPGPANYNTSSAASLLNRQSPSYRIGSAQRYGSSGGRSGSPAMVGPGAYEAKKVIGEEGKKFSMSWKMN